MNEEPKVLKTKVEPVLKPDEIVAASSSFAILVGIGAVMGPILVSSFMSLIGANGFFIYLLIVIFLICLKFFLY